MNLKVSTKFTLKNGVYIGYLTMCLFSEYLLPLNVTTIIFSSSATSGIGSVNGGGATRSGVNHKKRWYWSFH